MKHLNKAFYAASATLLCSVAVGLAVNTDTPIASLKTAPQNMRHTNVVPKKFPGSNTTLNGAMVYNDLWGEKKPDGTYMYPITSGIYSIQAREGGKVQSVQQISDFCYMKSGLYLNGVYYVFTAEGQEGRTYMSQYSASTWSRTSKQEIDFVNFPTDLTYDPVTKKTYGFFYNDETQYYDRFCSFSTYYGEATDIGRGMDRDCCAIAANKDGEIYGIWGATGWLIKINPKTGTYEQIGRLGVYPGDFARGYVNSLTFDDATGKLYWASNDDYGKSALYEINLTTGAATKVMDFENNASFAGLYALPYTVSGSAPAEPTDVSVTFSSMGSTEALISFTTPLLTVNGQPITEEIGVLVSAGDQENDVENLTPGAKASCTLTLAEGENTITLTPYSDSPGASVTVTTWGGEDIPGVPANLTLSDVNGVPTLSWEAPEAGVHGGLYDKENVRYRVVKNNDNSELARDLTDTNWADDTFSGTAAVSYSVYAYTSKGEGPAASSEKIVFGEGYTVPFVCGFDNVDEFDLWTVVDLNGNSKWEYSSTNKYIYSKYDDKGAADDWIFSPKFKAEKGKVYQLELDASVLQNSNPKYAENFEVWLTGSPTPDSKVVEILNCQSFLSKEAKKFKAFFKVPDTGWYHLGIYTDSPVTHWQLNIDNVGVTEIDSHVPAAVTDLSVVPGEKGELSAAISFKMPENDTENRALTEKMSVAIYVDGNDSPVYTAEELEPGASVTTTHTPEDSGLKTYRVVPSTPAGNGEEVSASAFIGVDAPGAPGSLKAVQNNDGDVVLTWTAPEKGMNGGWFDPEQLTYRIVRSDGTALSNDCKGTTFTDNTLRISKQELFYYLVTPYCGSTKGAYAYTDFDVFGPAYKAPLAETFPGGDMKWYPWVSESDGPTHVWCLETSGVDPSTPDQNGDGGLAIFVSTQSTKGITGSFSSPKVDISSLEKPELSFRMYHSKANEGENEAIDLYILVPGGEWTKLNDSPLLRDNGTEGWQRHAFPLASIAEAGGSEVRIRFVGKALGGANIHFDNIVFDNERNIDLEVTALSAPSKVGAGIEVPMSATVGNNGNAEITNALLTLSAGDETIATYEIEKLQPGQSLNISFNHTFAATGKYLLKLSGKVADDSDNSNDEALFNINIVEPVVPTVDGLTAGAPDNGNITLEWLPPYSCGAVTDDIESYADWAIEGIGDWITVDLDRDMTYCINKDLENYPYQNDPKAFQVCNAETLGINIWPQGTPKSGNKMLMSMANINTVNNDWLISPLLNGEAQTVSFFAKAFTTQDVNPEKMVVYYSEGSVDPADFIKVSAGESITVDENWNEYKFMLPAGARRFAVRCVSDNAFALFIDDLKFNDLTVPSVKVDRYEVYRNDEKIGETNATVFSDNLQDAGLITADYHVRALYDNGTSAQSAKYTVMTSAINGIEGNDIQIISGKGTLTVKGATGLDIDIIAPDATKAAVIKTAGSTEKFSLTPGVYLVRIGTRTVKAIVR